jgi:hypothetical protein
VPLIRQDSPTPEKKAKEPDNSERASQNDFPVVPFYELLDVREYVRTETKIIALCALKGRYGKELKLYQWKWRGDQKGWKVGLANLKVESLNLRQIAEDAQLLARKCGISLKWV